MVRPSIRGAVLAGHAEVFVKHLESHHVDPRTLRLRFLPDDLEVLRGWVHPTAWYDIGLYTRLLEFLRDEAGHGDDQYLIDAGRRSAENMIRAAVYPQFEFLRRLESSGRATAPERFVAFGRDLRHLITINEAMLNFASNHVILDPEHADRYVIEHVDAAAYPEVLCWTTQGFCNRMAEEHGAPDLWIWERPSRDRVWYRMVRPL